MYSNNTPGLNKYTNPPSAEWKGDPDKAPVELKHSVLHNHRRLADECKDDHRRRKVWIRVRL